MGKRRGVVPLLISTVLFSSTASDKHVRLISARGMVEEKEGVQGGEHGMAGPRGSVW
jgi:hypothetical protein